MTMIDETVAHHAQEIVRGDVPGGPSTSQTIMVMLGEQLIDPLGIRSDLAPELAEFLVKACAPYRNERFAIAREMKDALSALRRGGG